MKRMLLFALWTTFVFSLGLTAQESSEEFAPFSIKLEPVADVNPIKTQHTIVATVMDRSGKPIANQKVEWILARGPEAVGDIVEFDRKDATVNNERLVKQDNHYTVTYTNSVDRVLDMGTPDTRDDIPVKVGETWITITSPIPGKTHIIAFCPGIRNADQHKAFAIKHWIDAKISWPEDAVNKVGTPHTFLFKIVKASTNAPLVGYQVKWDLLQGDMHLPAYLGTSEEKKQEQGQTSALGESSVVLNQIKPQEGENKVKIELLSPEGELLATRTVTKRWISPKIVVNKIGPADGIINEKINYTIEISNPGAAEANDVVVKDTLPEGFSYLEASIAPEEAVGKVLTWKIGTLPQNGTRRINLTVKADQVGRWTNVVEVTSREFPPQSSRAETLVGAPELYIIKEGPAEVRKDNMATYTIILKNNGNAVAKDVFIRDEVPAGMEYRGKVDGFNLKWVVGELNPSQDIKYSYTVRAIQTGTFVNTAKVFLRNREVHKAECQTKVIAPDLKLTKEGSLRIYLGKPAEYTINVVNDGNAVAKEMVLVDTLPKELEYISSEPRGIFKPAKGEELATVTWRLGDLAPGTTTTIKLQTRAVSSATNILVCRNTVKLRSDSPELPQIQPLEAFAETTIMGVPAMHIGTYDVDDPIEVGKTTIYVIEIRNEGSSACTNVKFESHLDDEMEFVSATGPTPNRPEGLNKVIFDPYPILQPNAKLIFKVVAKGVKTGSAKNTATVRYDQFDKPIIAEEGTTVYK